MKYNFDTPTDRRGTPSMKWSDKDGELPMWVADMDFETAPAVREAICKTAQHGIFGYSDLPNEYFESISGFWHRRFGYRFEPSEMIFATGVVAAISSIVRKLTTPGEKVLIQAPVYNIFYNSILNNGRFVVSSDLVYEGGEYSVDFSDLEEKLADKQTSLMILCNPHNPVGKVWNKQTLARIGELCHKHGVTVVSDEIHCPVTSPGVSYVPFASASDICKKISVTCISASKAFNIAGLAAAAVVVSDPVLRHKVWRGINTDEVGEPNIFAVTACIAAYRDSDEWLDELNAYIFENKRYAAEYIKKNISALVPVRSDATYLLWVDVSAYTDDSDEFTRDLREKTGLYLSDGAQYGGGGKRFVRINLGTQRAVVEDAMHRLKSYVDTLKTRK
jgi:cystathionine beta-lyase